MSTKICYYNYRCRKCEAIVSVRRHYSNNVYSSAPYLATSQTHKCLKGVAEDERTIMDCISISDSPLLDAYEVIDEIK